MSTYSEQAAEQDATIRKAGLDPATTTVFDSGIGEVAVIRPETEDDYPVVAVSDQLIRDAGWVNEQEADDAKYEAVAEAEKDVRENIIYELRSALDSLVRATEVGRLDGIVSSVDIALHGEAVAIARAAFEIALEAAGDVPAWQR